MGSLLLACIKQAASLSRIDSSTFWHSTLRGTCNSSREVDEDAFVLLLLLLFCCTFEFRMCGLVLRSTRKVDSGLKASLGAAWRAKGVSLGSKPVRCLLEVQCKTLKLNEQAQNRTAKAIGCSVLLSCLMGWGGVLYAGILYCVFVCLTNDRNTQLNASAAYASIRWPYQHDSTYSFVL